ncbi:serine/threonine protein kinase [Candidatus Woesearchaeota archaeon]|nr:MAG: serine/threonine protein kinase [Candidatus Woesearchaeota archaeon]
MARIFKEEWKVYGNVFDQYTLRNLFKLQTQGHFEDLLSPVALGKEANIFTAKTKEGKVIIIKIYRLQTCNFNKMYDYIKTDPRFINLKKQRRKIIFAWTLREFRNLLKFRELVEVPTPITVLDNIILMEMIGRDEPAPQLKDSVPENREKFSKELISSLKKIYDKGYVHGDLSEYNILNFDDELVFIDFSQSTTRNDPNFKEYWERDIKNVARYFKKIGLKTSEEELKEQIFK